MKLHDYCSTHFKKSVYYLGCGSNFFRLMLPTKFHFQISSQEKSVTRMSRNRALIYDLEFDRVVI